METHPLLPLFIHFLSLTSLNISAGLTDERGGTSINGISPALGDLSGWSTQTGDQTVQVLFVPAREKDEPAGTHCPMGPAGEDEVQDMVFQLRTAG